MADAIVSLAIERISDLLIHEAVFLKDVKDQVQSLMTVLNDMQSFLEDVSRMPEQDNRLRNRVSQIRDLAYDAEDVIDSFILEAAHQRDAGTVERFASIATRPFLVHDIGKQVEEILTKLENISKSLPALQIPDYGEGSSPTSRVQKRLRRTFSHVEEEDVVSLEVSTEDVVAKLMTEENRIHAVVSIVGMGGIGKTTLARKVYNLDVVRRHFDCMAWVSISQQCNPREVLHDVLMKVQPGGESIDHLNENQLIKKLYVVLGEKRYLIVLDDIWRSEDWDILKHAFPRGRKGSKVLLTTRIRDVVLHATPVELPFLTVDESWNLLRRKAFPQNNTDSHVYSEEFENLGREMVKKCGGLPLAIVVLGSLLATKQTLDQWKMVQRNIHGHLKGFKEQDRYSAVKGILALSYNDLPYHLKPCFLYLGHYPEDSEISKKELIRLWIAEGFISPAFESTETLLEDKGERYLEELINRSLVRISRRGYRGTNVKTCRLHDLLRDLCVEKAREESFLEIIHPRLIGNSADCIEVTLAEHMPRRISVHPSKRDVRLKGEHPKLRSLLLFQNDERLIELEISKCKRFKFLRVLKLVENKVENWHVSREIGNLHHLRYLKLKGRDKIILPESVGRLKSLYTLNVVCEWNIEVPDVVFKLERLRHILLLASQGCLLRRFNISEKIETLKIIRVDKEFNQAMLSRMANIQSLGLKFSRLEDVNDFVMSLTESHRLVSLAMEFPHLEGRLPCQNWEPLSRCHELSKLKLIGEIGEDPHQSHHHVLRFLPQNIVKLTFWRSRIKQDPMGVLEKLPCLRILGLGSHSYEGSKMICSANEFPQLHSLEMNYLPKLEEWEIEEGAIPRLRNLRLKYLPELKMLPEGLRYITTLQQLKLIGMNSALKERVKVRDEEDGRQGKDFYEVRHIPSLIIQ